MCIFKTACNEKIEKLSKIFHLLKSHNSYSILLPHILYAANLNKIKKNIFKHNLKYVHKINAKILLKKRKRKSLLNLITTNVQEN